MPFRVGRTCLAAVLIAVGLAPAPLWGQHRRSYVGGGLGPLAPQGSFGDVDKTGWHLLLNGARAIKGPLGLTVDAVYGQTTHQNSVDGNSTLTGAAVNVALFLTGESRRLRPLVFAGIGGYQVNVDVPGFGSAATTKLAVQYGGGLLVGIGPRQAFFTVRYLSVRTAPQRTAFLPITAGIMLPVGFP